MAGFGRAGAQVYQADPGLVAALVPEGFPGFGEAGLGRVALS